MTRGSALTVLALAAALTPPSAQLDAMDWSDRSRPRRSIKPQERAERKKKTKAAKASKRRNR